MTIAHSKLTAQGQIDQDEGQIVVRRVGRYTSEDVHRALFPKLPKPQSLDGLKEGIRRYMLIRLTAS